MREQELSELANLARLRIRPDRRPALAAELDRLLAHFAALSTVDTRDVDPDPTPGPHHTRPDTPEAPLQPDQVVANAPATRGGCFLVPRVVEG